MFTACVGSLLCLLTSAPGWVIPVHTVQEVPNPDIRIAAGPTFLDVPMVTSVQRFAGQTLPESVVSRRIGQYVSVTGSFLEPPEYPLTEVSWKLEWDPSCLEFMDMVSEENANGSIAHEPGSDGKSVTLTWTAPSDTDPENYAPFYRAVFKCIGVPDGGLTAIEAVMLRAVDRGGETVERVSVENPDKIAIYEGAIRWQIRIEGYINLEMAPVGSDD